MKPLRLYTILALIMFAVASCEKADIADNSSGNTGSRLIVRTSANVAGSDDTDFVNYPVNIYVMDSSGKCIATQQIDSVGEELNIETGAGKYDVYAVAGYNNYNLPTADEATAQSVIALKEGMSHGDLMTACSNIVMTKGEENRVTIQLQRRVIQVQSITLNNIPDDVMGVQITLSPLNSGIMLNGDYVEGSYSHTITLTKQADGTTWASTESEYLLEAQSNLTLTVSLTKADGVTSYSYTSDSKPTANQKVNIAGNFIDEPLTLSGTITGMDWAETVNVDFDFGYTSNTETNDSTEINSETLYGGAPQAGTLYKGCYVLRTSNTEKTTTVTLITPSEQNKLKISSSKDETKVQTSIKTAAEEALDDIAVSGISGWRLPTREEIEYLADNVTSINERIAALNNESLAEIAVMDGVYECGYFFTDTDSNIYVYVISTQTTDTSPGSERATYKVRGFTTLTFSD